MKRKLFVVSLATILSLSMYGCAENTASNKEKDSKTTTEVVTEEMVEENSETDFSLVAPTNGSDNPLDTTGMSAVYANEVRDGVYDVVVDTDSSVFRIESANAVASEGNITAELNLVPNAEYSYVYLGTAEEAAALNDVNKYIEVSKSGDTRSFTIPVAVLDEPISIAAFSEKAEMWYNEQILFRTDSLPISYLLTEASADGMGGSNLITATDLELSDGAYKCEVTLGGGSGKASVDSPTTVFVSDTKLYAHITMSSPYYDYCIVDGVKYFPINTSGNSTFEIPVAGFDDDIPFIADTTKMSEPHEIAYTLFFDSMTLEMIE